MGASWFSHNKIDTQEHKNTRTKFKWVLVGSQWELLTSNLGHKQKQYTYDTNAKVQKYKASVRDHVQVGASRGTEVEFIHPVSPGGSVKFFFCLGTQPSQFIKVLNSGILLPYQHVKHKINLTLRPGITFTFLKFLLIVDTISSRHLL